MSLDAKLKRSCNHVIEIANTSSNKRFTWTTKNDFESNSYSYYVDAETLPGDLILSFVDIKTLTFDKFDMLEPWIKLVDVIGPVEPVIE